ncbi:30S ribosomal protein S11 [bacterium]|nr:30S ribosomal protein S11 [bacterium]
MAEKKIAEKKTSKPAVKRKGKKKVSPECNVYIQASYNNTIVTITEPNGDVVSWSSAGSSGFKGSRKSTPYAAQVAAENAVEKAKPVGIEKVNVFVKGVGSGREQAIRGLNSSGLHIITITDVTPISHNGCRQKKQRRN